MAEPSWLPTVRRLHRQHPDLHPFTLAVLADPDGTGRPTWPQVRDALQTSPLTPAAGRLS